MALLPVHALAVLLVLVVHVIHLMRHLIWSLSGQQYLRPLRIVAVLLLSLLLHHLLVPRALSGAKPRVLVLSVCERV